MFIDPFDVKGPMSSRIRMYWAVSVVHAGCWLPLYCDTLIQWGRGNGRGSQTHPGATLSHEVTTSSVSVTSSLSYCVTIDD